MNYFGIWKRLAVSGADEQLVGGLKNSPKVPFRERWKQNARHWQYYTIFLYTCVSSAAVFKTELSKQL